MRLRQLILPIGAICGCASGRVVLEKPIADQCQTSGLKSCNELTEGVLLYIEGDQQNAVHKLHLAVNANEPEEVLAFADGLKTVSQIPGAGQMTAPIQQVINVLATEARRAGETKRMTSRKLAAGGKSAARRRSDDQETDPPERAEPVAARSVVDQTAPTKVVSAVTPPSALSARLMDLEGSTVIPAVDEGMWACSRRRAGRLDCRRPEFSAAYVLVRPPAPPRPASRTGRISARSASRPSENSSNRSRSLRH
jgi:hypothetical protein